MGALQKLASGGQADTAAGDLPSPPQGGSFNPIQGIVTHLNDIWGQANQRLNQYDAMNPQRVAAMKAYQQSLLQQNQDPNGAFVRGWSTAMLSGHPDVAMQWGNNMETQQQNANAARAQMAAGAGYSDISNNQAQQLDIYKTQLGSAGSGAMGAMFRYDPNAHVGSGLYDKWSHELVVPPDLTGTYQKLYGQALAVAQKVEATNPQAYAQYGGSLKYADMVARNQIAKIIQTRSVAGGANRAGLPEAQINPSPTPQPGPLGATPPSAPALSPSAGGAPGAAPSLAGGPSPLQGAPQGAPGAASPAPVATPPMPNSPNIDVANEAVIKGQAENLVKAQQQYRQNLYTVADAGRNFHNMAQEIEGSVNELEQTGGTLTPSKIAPVANAVLQYANAVGFDLSPEQQQAIANATTVEKLNAQLATLSTKQISSRPGVYEFATFLKQNPNLAMTPQTIHKLMQFMDNNATVSTDMPSDYELWSRDHPRAFPAQPGQDGAPSFDAYYTSRRQYPAYWSYLASQGLGNYQQLDAYAKQHGISVDELLKKAVANAKRYKAQ